MVLASRSTVMRRAGAFLALVAFEIAAVVVLHRLGELPWLRIPLDDLEGWLQTSAPEDVLAAVVRLIALGAAWWLLGSTALYVLARLSRIPNAVRAVELITLPSVRRLADQAIALTLATSIMSGGASAALANPAGLASGRPQAAVASHDPLATWTHVSALGYRPTPTTQDTPSYQPEAAGNPAKGAAGAAAEPEEPGYHPEAAGTASGSTGAGDARATPSGRAGATGAGAKGAGATGAGAGAGTAGESGGDAGTTATTAASPTTSTSQPPTTTSPSPSSTSTAPPSTAPGSTRPEPTRAPSAVEPPPAAKPPAAGYVPGVAGPAPSARSGATGYVPGAAGPAPKARSGVAGPSGAAGPAASSTTRPPAPAPPGYRPGVAGRPPAQQAPLPGDPSDGSEPGLHPVVAGDNLWTIARDHLAKVTHRRPSELTEREIARYWLEVVDANRAELPSGDPDIIRPGDKIKLPPVTTRREP